MKTSIKKQRHPAKQLWRRTIADQSRVGLSIRAYCRREDLAPWNVRWCRSELVRREFQVASGRTADRSDSAAEVVHTQGILAVRVVADSSMSIAAAFAIEIVLPAGPIFRVNRGFDPPALDAVLSVLKTRC